jgi:hypothetical protein
VPDLSISSRDGSIVNRIRRDDLSRIINGDQEREIADGHGHAYGEMACVRTALCTSSTTRWNFGSSGVSSDRAVSRLIVSRYQLCGLAVGFVRKAVLTWATWPIS